MVKNEAPTILRMLNSVYQYIDYWVIQDNGSTDGTQEIINKFFEEKGIPGFLYQIYEWKGHGWNRDHTLQAALKAEHGCDWILRVDADEQLVVDEEFDWSPFNDTSVQSFNIMASAARSRYYRTWIWNASLPWYFAHDLAHETIHLPEVDQNFQRVNLPVGIRHVITNDGMTWHKPMKFLKDALNLELTKVTNNEVLKNPYHLWYIGKSYADCYGNPDDFPFKMYHAKEYARRCIFYFEMHLNHEHNWFASATPSRIDDMSYYAVMLIGNAHAFLGNLEDAEYHYRVANKFSPNRNEALLAAAHFYEKHGMFEKMKEATTEMMKPERKNPFPVSMFLIDDSAYYDTNPNLVQYHQKAVMLAAAGG
jgi:glycosyltransferase involved in cell wall biosynthesis